MNVKLTKKEYELIRKLLEQGYYFAKDEGRKGEMNSITKLEEKLIKIYNENEE